MLVLIVLVKLLAETMLTGRTATIRLPSAAETSTSRCSAPAEPPAAAAGTTVEPAGTTIL